MAKFFYYLIRLLGVVLFLALFAVPAGDKIGLGFVGFKLINLLLLWAVSEAFKLFPNPSKS